MDRRILVTGAASGLGRALATAAAADGARVLLTDSDAAAGELARLELAEQLRAGGEDPERVAFLSLDVRSDAAWEQARDWCATEWSGLDVLVNNAGVAAAGHLADIPMQDWEWIVEINLMGVIRGVRTFLPAFAAQGDGHVVNIASLAGLLNPARMASYNVTKAGVISLSETMRHELAGYGVHTTVVCPSFFATNIADRMRVTDPAFEVMGRRMISGEGIPGRRMSADDVARSILRSMDRGRFWALPHLEGRVLWAVKRHAPWLSELGDRALNRMLRRLLGEVSRGGAPAERQAVSPGL